MSFTKVHSVLRTAYNQHGLDNPKLHKYRDLFREVRETVTGLSNSLSTENGYNNKLANTLDKLCYDYLCKSYSNDLQAFSKKVEYLLLVLSSIKDARVMKEDISGYNASCTLAGIKKSLLHKESSCCSLLSFFYVSAEKQLCNDISKAIDDCNTELHFDEMGYEGKKLRSAQ